MRTDLKAFFVAIAFISGASLAAALSSRAAFFVALIFCAGVFLFRKRLGIKPLFCAVIILIFLFGAFYFYLGYRRQGVLPDGSPIKGKAIVSSYPERNMVSQKLSVSFLPPLYGRGDVFLRLYPSFSYGDVVEFSGKASHGRSGRLHVYFPEARKIASGRGGFVSEQLFALRENLVSNIREKLPVSSAALAAGILVGDQSDFSESAWERFRKTGTTHLVALSGFNIMIIASGALAVSGFISRRATFILPPVVVVLFVIMAGGGASVVRAAIMGLIVILGRGVGRAASMRNAITFAALAMVVWDPGVVVFDVGFGLSFAATIGIVYLAPFIRRRLKLSPHGVRDLLIDTASAEAAVLPIIMARFGAPSWYSLPANLAVIPLVPLAMIFSFAVAVLGFIPGPLSGVAAFPADIILQYELKAIDIFTSVF